MKKLCFHFLLQIFDYDLFDNKLLFDEEMKNLLFHLHLINFHLQLNLILFYLKFLVWLIILIMNKNLNFQYFLIQSL